MSSILGSIASAALSATKGTIGSLISTGFDKLTSFVTTPQNNSSFVSHAADLASPQSSIIPSTTNTTSSHIGSSDGVSILILQRLDQINQSLARIVPIQAKTLETAKASLANDGQQNVSMAELNDTMKRGFKSMTESSEGLRGSFGKLATSILKPFVNDLFGTDKGGSGGGGGGGGGFGVPGLATIVAASLFAFNKLVDGKGMHKDRGVSSDESEGTAGNKITKTAAGTYRMFRNPLTYAATQYGIEKTGLGDLLYGTKVETDENGNPVIDPNTGKPKIVPSGLISAPANYAGNKIRDWTGSETAGGVTTGVIETAAETALVRGAAKGTKYGVKLAAKKMLNPKTYEFLARGAGKIGKAIDFVDRIPRMLVHPVKSVKSIIQAFRGAKDAAKVVEAAKTVTATAKTAASAIKTTKAARAAKSVLSVVKAMKSAGTLASGAKIISGIRSVLGPTLLLEVILKTIEAMIRLAAGYFAIEKRKVCNPDPKTNPYSVPFMGYTNDSLNEMDQQIENIKNDYLNAIKDADDGITQELLDLYDDRLRRVYDDQPNGRAAPIVGTYRMLIDNGAVFCPPSAGAAKIRAAFDEAVENTNKELEAAIDEEFANQIASDFKADFESGKMSEPQLSNAMEWTRYAKHVNHLKNMAGMTKDQKIQYLRKQGFDEKFISHFESGAEFDAKTKGQINAVKSLGLDEDGQQTAKKKLDTNKKKTEEASPIGKIVKEANEICESIQSDLMIDSLDDENKLNEKLSLLQEQKEKLAAIDNKNKTDSVNETISSIDSTIDSVKNKLNEFNSSEPTAPNEESVEVDENSIGSLSSWAQEMKDKRTNNLLSQIMGDDFYVDDNGNRRLRDSSGWGNDEYIDSLVSEDASAQDRLKLRQILEKYGSSIGEWDSKQAESNNFGYSSFEETNGVATSTPEQSQPLTVVVPQQESETGIESVEIQKQMLQELKNLNKPNPPAPSSPPRVTMDGGNITQ